MPFLVLSFLFAGPPAISWERITIDPIFRSEGCGVADVNRDGKLDVLNGEFWYQGSDFKIRHEMRKPGDYADGFKNYSETFCVFIDDFNADGYPDAIVIDYPGTPCYWLENPAGKPGHWKKHIIWHSACNETPLYVDLLGNGKKVLVMGFQPKDKKATDNLGQMAYFTPNPMDPTALWEMHPISNPSTPGDPAPGTMRFSHGLGVGDINGDGRLDIFTSGTNTKGKAVWWEQPANKNAKTPWKSHFFDFGDACADMYADDLDGDGKADIICSSAHKYGIWMLKQRPDSNGGDPAFSKTDLFPDLVSETHALHYVDMDGDGLKDLVTGKRYWSHGKNEPGSDKPAMVYWFKASKASDGLIRFTPKEIDNNSGIGTQFSVIDLNGDGWLDIATSNKKGTHVIFQKRN